MREHQTNPVLGCRSPPEDRPAAQGSRSASMDRGKSTRLLALTRRHKTSPRVRFDKWSHAIAGQRNKRNQHQHRKHAVRANVISPACGMCMTRTPPENRRRLTGGAFWPQEGILRHTPGGGKTPLRMSLFQGVWPTQLITGLRTRTSHDRRRAETGGNSPSVTGCRNASRRMERCIRAEAARSDSDVETDASDPAS